MPSRDPALIVSFGARSDRRAIGTQDRDLITRIDLLAALSRALRTIAALSTTSLLRKQRRDPGVVDEVDGSAKEGEEEEVEEDAVRR